MTALGTYTSACIRDPGVIQSLKLMRNPAVHSTEPQSVDFSNQSPLTEMVNQNKLITKTQEPPKEIEDENSGPISISALGKNAVVSDSDEEQDPPQRVSVEISRPQEESCLQIETRFCTICTMEQPLRAKHCRICNVCVAVYDHHCPWMGNCVGERNRFNFWWYLLTECFLLNWSGYLLYFAIKSETEFLVWVKINWIVLLAFVIVANFSLMVSFLLAFHTFLALTNRTTWEQLSWDKISYLNKWPKELGSPFHKGIFGNIYYYCCKPLPKGYTLWNYPTKFPS